jgi:hypothetical protein
MFDADLSALRLEGLHHVKRAQADGSLKSYFYAWRGGPRIIGTTPDELADAFSKARARHNPEWKAPRPVRQPLPKNPEQVLNRACRRVLDNAKNRAAKKGIDITLSPDCVRRMAETQKWRCAISDIPFDLAYDREGKHAYNPFGMSIDRLNCSKGYTPKNVRLILTAVNFGLNDWGEEIYLRIAKAVVARDIMKQIA